MEKWKYTKYDNEYYNNEYYIDTVDNKEIAHLNNESYLNVEKNAKLIANAPALLETAKELLMEIGHYGSGNKLTLNKLEDIIKTIEEVK